MSENKKLTKKEYHKQYYLKNKEKIKERSRKQYLNKKGIDTEIKVELKRGVFIVDFD